VVISVNSGSSLLPGNTLTNWVDPYERFQEDTLATRLQISILFGEYDFTGTLSFSWPRDISRVTINVGDRGGFNPLFAFNYGLNYGGTIPTRQPTLEPTPSPTPASGRPGDVNEDGSIDIVDVLLTAQYSVGLIVEFPG
jgi:hypothetical protein